MLAVLSRLAVSVSELNHVRSIGFGNLTSLLSAGIVKPTVGFDCARYRVLILHTIETLFGDCRKGG